MTRIFTVCSAGADSFCDKWTVAVSIHTHGTGCLCVVEVSVVIGTSLDSCVCDSIDDDSTVSCDRTEVNS